jgi:hypothetical protein
MMQVSFWSNHSLPLNQRARIDDDSIYPVLLCLVDAVDDRTLVIGLEGGKKCALFLGNCICLVDDILQRFVTIDMWFTGAKKVEIGSINEQDADWGCHFLMLSAHLAPDSYEGEASEQDY